MATYNELFAIERGNNDLENRVAVAATIKAHALLVAASPIPNEVAWAEKALVEPKGVGRKLLRFVLAANAGLTVAQIEGASDAAIQSNIDEAADALIAGGVI